MKILVVVDCQNDFITGTLGTPEAIEAVPNICKKIREFDGRIYVTMDTHHTDTYLQTYEGQHLPIWHCIEGSRGWQIQKDIVKALDSKNTFSDIDGIVMRTVHTIYKHTYGTDELMALVAMNFDDSEVEEIEVVGFCTDICVITNVLLLRTYFPEIPITVDASCCAGSKPELHEKALDVMKACHVNITNRS